MWVRAWAASSKGADSLVWAWFRAGWGMNVIKQGEPKCNRLTWRGGSVVECLHVKRGTLGSSPGLLVGLFPLILHHKH